MAERTELSSLNHLLDICRDGENGFAFAAQHAPDADLHDLFATLADERRRFAAELEPHVRRLGGQGLSDGSAGGAIHRGWMTFKNAIPGRHDAMLIAEAERGERVALHAYEAALEDLLPPTVTDIVERQAASIRGTHARIVAIGQAHGLPV